MIHTLSSLLNAKLTCVFYCCCFEKTVQVKTGGGEKEATEDGEAHQHLVEYKDN